MIRFAAWLFEVVFFTTLTVLCTLAVIFAVKPTVVAAAFLFLKGVFNA